MQIISLGWGVQSFTLVAMSALGELPMVDAAIHADTTHERMDTYNFAAKVAPWLESKGVRVVTVRDEKAAAEVLNKNRKNLYAPFHTSNGGQLFRQCTDRWKVRPIHRWVRAELKARGEESAIQWMGISWDEVQRVKQSHVKYITNHYPLIGRRMTRADCEKWLYDRGLPIPPKSACVFCPFHSNAAWRSLSDGDRMRAIQVDEAIRHARPGLLTYAASARRPLAEVFEAHNLQPDLFNAVDECSGHCFV